MPTPATVERAQDAAATAVRFESGNLIVTLDDGRSVAASIAGTRALRFLRDASEQARMNWTIEPHGFAVYWPDLDDGVEVCHLVAGRPRSLSERGS